MTIAEDGSLTVNNVKIFILEEITALLWGAYSFRNERNEKTHFALTLSIDSEILLDKKFAVSDKNELGHTFQGWILTEPKFSSATTKAYRLSDENVSIGTVFIKNR